MILLFLFFIYLIYYKAQLDGYTNIHQFKTNVKKITDPYPPDPKYEMPDSLTYYCDNNEENNKCDILTEYNCKQAKCCVLVNAKQTNEKNGLDNTMGGLFDQFIPKQPSIKNKCVSGDISGPVFKSDNSDSDSYYYMNQKYNLS
jgi:hypothetical protein